MPNIKKQYFGSTQSSKADNAVRCSDCLDFFTYRLTKGLLWGGHFACRCPLQNSPYVLLCYQGLSGSLAGSFLSYFMVIILTNFILCFPTVVLSGLSQDSEGNAWSFTSNAYILTPFASFFSFPLRKVLNLFVNKCSSSRIYPAGIIFLMGNLMGPPTDRGDHPICSEGRQTLPAQMERHAADQGLMYIHCLFNIRASFSKDISIELTCGVTIWKISSLTPLR